MPSDLTVVVPTIGRRTLTRTVDSILDQTVPCEYLVVSDLARNGTGPTQNLACESVATTYVGFVGDDDRLDIRYHEWMLDVGEFDLLVFTMQYPGGVILPQSGTEPGDLSFGSVGGSYVIRTELVRAHPFITEDATAGLNEDWWMIRTLRDAGAKVVVSPRIAYFVRH